MSDSVKTNVGKAFKEKKEEKKLMCFECKTLGHIKYACLVLAKNIEK